jgi:hypothetical protein
VLTKAETEEAALPLVLVPGPHSDAGPAPIATKGHWRRRQSFREGCGQWIRSHGSEREWRVSPRESPFGFCIYLRTLLRSLANGKAAPPLVALRALNGFIATDATIHQGSGIRISYWWTAATTTT